MDTNKLIAEWMNRLRAELSRCLNEEMKKVDLTRLLHLSVPERISATAKQPAEASAKAQLTDSDPIMPRRHWPNLCAVEGCDRPARAIGLCGMHYQRAQYAARKQERVTSSKHVEKATPPALVVSPAAVPKAANSAPDAAAKISGAYCAHPDCEREALKKGLCGKHFMEWVRTLRQLGHQHPLRA